MIISEDRLAITARLAEAPLANVALLKHLFLDPAATRALSAMSGDQQAVLVLLDAAASPWDRATYPTCALVAFLSSNAAALSSALLGRVPLAGGVVFKLQSDADRSVLAALAASERTARFFSYTAATAFRRDPAVRVTTAPLDADFALIAEQGHERDVLVAKLQAGDAFFCVLDDPASAGMPAAVCCVFRNHGPVFEIGGVVTRSDRRREGLAGRVVATALAVLAERGLIARYHVADGNTASIALAERLGLQRFLTLTHDHVRPGAPPAILRSGGRSGGVER